MKEIWFQYIVDNKQYWCHGVTLNRLHKIKDAVLSDKDIMWDLLSRHGADKETPEQMKEIRKETFRHCIGNFSTAILYKMMDKGMINR